MDHFGELYRLTDCGESHGEALGGIIEGCPIGLFIDKKFIDNELIRRAGGNHPFATKRKEVEKVSFYSGITNGNTTGAPIGFIIKNAHTTIDSASLNIIKPSHASFTYKEKYGALGNNFCDRASARQTICRVVAGAIAKLALAQHHITIETAVMATGIPQKEGDSFGAKIACTIYNLPTGLGDPVYNKFQARLAYAMLSINACKGFEIGKGFESAIMCGSDYNDLQNSDFSFQTNHDGGVQAGITNGEPVIFNLAFKPIPSINLEQQTIDFEGNPITYRSTTPNDLSVVPRVLPIVEAMAAMVVLDFILLQKIH
ncbi:MAG: chorismate synthase [Bacteroidales bacterium]|jgi:chorismate synthase|nr:chorismate synthase [Bacteroidales bacterium]